MTSTPFDLRSWELLTRPELTVHRDIVASIVRSTKFLLSDGVSETFCEFGDSLIVEKAFIPPFDESLLEFSSPSHEDRLSVLSVAADAIIWLVPFYRSGGGWSGGFDYRIGLDLKRGEWLHSPKYDSSDAGLWFGCQRLVADSYAGTVAALGSSSCDVGPLVGVPDRLRRSRDRSGKPPVFEYRTVRLKTSRSASTAADGTHSSPALHWRRGHFRNIGDRIVPIASCLVGDISRGFVWKDYDAREINQLSRSENLAIR